MATRNDQPYTLTVTHADDEERQTIRQGVIAFNRAARPHLFDPNAETRWLNVYLHDADGRLIGGAVGELEWNQLYVNYLWVDDAQRGRGLGRELLSRLEAEAQTHGCTYAILTTYEFQALDFYRKQGFRVVGQIEDFPPGSNYYLLRHDFV
jgi:ribosomal protein S18 acetylase RimI-like enzyme